MSELNDLLTTRELQRWRLILGEAAETTLCGLDDNARQIDHALEWLYGRDPEPVSYTHLTLPTKA